MGPIRVDSRDWSCGTQNKHRPKYSIIFHFVSCLRLATFPFYLIWSLKKLLLLLRFNIVNGETCYILTDSIAFTVTQLGLWLHYSRYVTLLSFYWHKNRRLWPNLSLNVQARALPAKVEGMGVVPTVVEAWSMSSTGLSVAPLVPGVYACVAWLVKWPSVAEEDLKEAWVPVVVACLSVDVNFVALGASVVSRVSPRKRN